MELEIIEGPIGEIGKYHCYFSKGKLIVDANVAVSPVESVNKLSVDAGVIIDAIKNAIPGKVDDVVLDILKAELMK